MPLQSHTQLVLEIKTRPVLVLEVWVPVLVFAFDS